MITNNNTYIMLVLKYSFYIVMIILAITNLVFFICNWKNLTITISNEALMLSVVGFFFAFAGINIYSIFNTNIEAEKSRLLELAEKYDNELKLSSEMLHYPQEVVLIYQVAQFLVAPDRLQPDSFDRIQQIKAKLDSLKTFVKGLKTDLRTPKYEQYKTELTSLATGIEQLLRLHKSRISHCGFFDEQPAQENNYNTQLDNLISFVDDLKYYEFEEEFGEDEVSLSFWEKCKKVVVYASRLFYNKS